MTETRLAIRYNTGISYLMVDILSHEFSSESHVRQFKVRIHYTLGIII